MFNWLKKKNEMQEVSSGHDQETDKDTKTATDDREESYGAGLIIESRGWYKDKFRQTTTLSLMLATMLTVSLFTNLVQSCSKPEPRYYAVSQDLRVLELQPLNEPFVSQDGLFNWTTKTITETFSFDFVHWRDQLMSTRQNYTEQAFEDLIGSLKNSGNLEMVRERRLVLSTSIVRSPVITAQGEIRGRMAWRMEFPLKLTYESSEGVVASRDLMCEVLVHRVQVTDHPRGIKIAQVILK